MKKSLIASVCLFIATVFLASLTSYNVSAISASVTGTSGVSATVNGRTYSGNTSNNSASLFRSWDSQSAYIYNGDLTALCFDTYNPIPAGSYFSVSVRLGQYSSSSGTNTNAIGLHNTFAGFSSGANWALISQNVESLDNTYIVINVQGLVGDTASTGFCFSPANGAYIASNDVSFSNFSIIVSPVSFWEDTNLTVFDITRAIDNSSQLQSLNDSMESMNDNQGRVADVAEDEYNQTQEDREQASSDANGFAFNFSLPNPFSIFQVSDGCVSTPTIDSWLHLEGDWQSPHCPIIPSNVRNTLTPIVTLIVSLASLMVVIRWVSSSNVGVSDDIGQGGYANSLTAKVNADKIRRAK